MQLVQCKHKCNGKHRRDKREENDDERKSDEVHTLVLWD